MQTTKKLSIYDLNPKFFKDYSGDGIGDLMGLANKFDYFKYLGVDAIILQDILSSHTNDHMQNFITVAKDVGNINNLQLVLSHAKKHGIKIFLEMKIGTITETHNWFQSAVDFVEERGANIVEFSSKKEEVGTEAKYNSEAKAYFPYNEKTREIPLNWESEKVIDKFIEVIKFWNDLGISGFVFKDFEYISDKKKENLMSETTLRELRKFYRSIKEVNDDIVVIGKSQEIELSNANEYTTGPTKVFDYFQSTRISMIGTYNKFGADVVGKFNATKLYKKMAKFANNPANIVSFGSENIGRFISRWGDSGQYNKESAKAFALISMLTPASSTIYYADELGARNIGLTHLDDFQDENLEIRKADKIAMKVSEKDFMDAQVLQSPINARSLMMWNSNKNGGFSSADKTITPPSVGYKENNVEIQYGDSGSVLNFYKELNRVVLKSSYSTIFQKGEWKMTNKVAINGVLKMTIRHHDKEIVVIANLTDSERRIISVPKVGNVVISTYADKTYDLLPKKLQAYEGIVISKHTDEFIKEAEAAKIQKQKEEEAAKEEAARAKAEKTREIEMQKEAEEAERLAKEAAIEEERLAKEAAKAEAKAAKDAEKANNTKEIKVEAEPAQQEKQTDEAISKDELEQKIVIEEEKLKAAEEAEKQAKEELAAIEAKEKELEQEALEKAAEQAKQDMEKAEMQAAKEAEKLKAMQLEQEARELKEKQLEEERIKREKEKQQKREEKEKFKEEKRAEKTRLIELKKAAKEERLAEKQAKEASLNDAKDQFSIMNEEIHPDEMTTLTEAEIAETTQIDVDDIEDIEEFLNNSK